MNICLRISPSNSIITALIKRTKFSDAFFRLSEFEIKRKTLLNEQFNQDEKIAALKENVKSILLKNSKIIRSDIENLFYVSKTGKDVELALEAFKSFVYFSYCIRVSAGRFF